MRQVHEVYLLPRAIAEEIHQTAPQQGLVKTSQPQVVHCERQRPFSRWREALVALMKSVKDTKHAHARLLVAVRTQGIEVGITKLTWSRQLTSIQNGLYYAFYLVHVRPYLHKMP